MLLYGGPKEGREHWVITYYGTGMSPQYEYFTSEEEALKVWDDWKDDPYKSVSTLKKETIVRTKR